MQAAVCQAQRDHRGHKDLQGNTESQVLRACPVCQGCRRCPHANRQLRRLANRAQPDPRDHQDQTDHPETLVTQAHQAEPVLMLHQDPLDQRDPLDLREAPAQTDHQVTPAPTLLLRHRPQANRDHQATQAHRDPRDHQEMPAPTDNQDQRDQKARRDLQAHQAPTASQDQRDLRDLPDLRESVGFVPSTVRSMAESFSKTEQGDKQRSLSICTLRTSSRDFYGFPFSLSKMLSDIFTTRLPLPAAIHNCHLDNNNLPKTAKAQRDDHFGNLLPLLFTIHFLYVCQRCSILPLPTVVL